MKIFQKKMWKVKLKDKIPLVQKNVSPDIQVQTHCSMLSSKVIEKIKDLHPLESTAWRSRNSKSIASNHLLKIFLNIIETVELLPPERPT